MSSPLYQEIDGACPAAQAVLALLRRNTIEDSWNPDDKCYEASPVVARWENCREQGYVVSLTNKNGVQRNIAFFEHRNSDVICAIVFDVLTLNSPVIGDIPDDHSYRNSKWSTSKDVSFDQHLEMSDWIQEQLESHWRG